MMLRRLPLVRTDISEEPSFSIIRVTRIGELGVTLAVISNRRTLRSYTKCNTNTNTKSLSIYSQLASVAS
jgi:hypothetical protein